MKIAIIFPTYWHSEDRSKSSIDITFYVDAVGALGHEAVIVCRNDSEYSGDLPVVAVAQERFQDQRFWKKLHIDIAIVFTWLGHVAMLKAIQEAGIYVVAKGDSDGMPSPRVFPRHHYQMMMSGAKTPFEKARSLRHWFRLRFFLFQELDQEIVRSISFANKTAVETEAARVSLGKFLAYYGQDALLEKLIVLPHLISEDILSAPVKTQKQNKIVAVGRWDSPQKDGALLASSLGLYLKSCPDTEVVLIGRGGEAVFASLCRHCPQVRYIGAVPHEKILTHIANARIMLVTSRWESFHIAAHEALSLGATVVGPAVIPILDVCREGAYGTLAAGRQPRQVAKALEREMHAWDNGQRNPNKIAEFWRPRLSGKMVVQRIIDLAAQEQGRHGNGQDVPQVFVRSG